MRSALRLVYARAMRPLIVRRYMRSHPVVKVILGAGGSRRQGWLSTDVRPVSKDIVFLDATKPFPFPDEGVDYFVAEHMIEHLPLEGGCAMLSHCFRALKPGGVVRVSTPNFDMYRPFLEEKLSGPELQYVVWSNTTFGSTAERQFKDCGVIAFNRAVRAWGHQFIYTPSFLADVLRQSGFQEVRRCALSRSDDPHLRSMELRASGFANEYETMVFEATKPKGIVPMSAHEPEFVGQGSV